MGDLNKFLKSLDAPTRKNNVVFGTTLHRTLNPDTIFPFRLGLVTYRSKQKPDIQPEFHDNHKFFNLVTESGKKIANKHGYIYRTEIRFKKLYEIPSSPRDYVEKIKKIKSPAQPFASGSKRFKSDSTYVPGPGTYIPDLLPKSKIKRLESFGGKITTVPPVTIKCSPENYDRCSVCENEPVGVYHESWDKILCRPCFNELVSSIDSNKWKDVKTISTFKKVRHCSFIHDHQKSDAAVWLKPISCLKKQRVLETYFNRYF